MSIWCEATRIGRKLLVENGLWSSWDQSTIPLILYTYLYIYTDLPLSLGCL